MMTRLKAYFGNNRSLIFYPTRNERQIRWHFYEGLVYDKSSRSLINLGSVIKELHDYVEVVSSNPSYKQSLDDCIYDEGNILRY